MEKLKLENLELRHDRSTLLLSGNVNGEQLYFKSWGDQPLSLRAEPFLSALLMPAMQAGSPLRIPDHLPVSGQFLNNLQQLQGIFQCWFPGLHRTRLDASTADSFSRNGTDSVAAFFSGGIDACYTLLKNSHSLTHLVYVRGIDMRLEQTGLWQQCLERNQRIAAQFNKTLVPVETNVRFFIRSISSPEIGWNQAVGCGLASLAHALGFRRIYISSSNTYGSLHPYGSHPLTDPLFSSEHTEIIHTGCEASRHEKLESIAEYPELLPLLRVCWQDKGFNCGHCDKCLHFRMALRLLNLEAGGLEPLNDLRELENAHTGTLGEYIEWKDNLVLARKVGDQQAIRALRKILNRFTKKEILKLADEVAFDGRFFAWKRRHLSSKNPHPGKIG